MGFGGMGAATMISLGCRRCGSVNLVKNGRTQSGQQKVKCNDCHFFGTLELRSNQKERRKELLDLLQLERLSQRAIARILHMSRNTIAKQIKKNRSADSKNNPATPRTPDLGT